MFYTYILLSKIDDKFYVGYTPNLKDRFEKHNKGEVISTRNRRPFELIYYEACKNEVDAILREKYFKTGFGRRFLTGRLRNFTQARDGGRGREKQRVIVKRVPHGFMILDAKTKKKK